MNSKILTIAAAATILASACDNWTPPVSPDGKADLSSVAITNDDAVKIIANDHVGRADDVDLSQYIVHVYSVDDPATPLYTWTYASMPEVITIPAATYRIGVESHSVAKAEWERPYFYGTSDAFTVEAGKIAKVGDVVCTFQSIRVSVRYDEDVLPLLGDDVAVTVKANDEGSLVFTANETRSGYFQYVAGSTTMAVNFHGTIDGALINNDFTFTDLAPGQHRIISIHRKLSPTPPEQTGDINPGFGIDLGVTTEDIDGNVTIEEENQTVKNPFEEDPEQGGTDPDPGKDPVVDPTPDQDEAATFHSDNLDTEGGINIPSEKTGGATVIITCPEGIAKLQVTIISEKLSPMLPDVGLCQSFDLVDPKNEDGKDLTTDLRGIGLPCGDEVKGKTEVTFDITMFMDLLVFEDDYDFELEVVDTKGKSSSLTLKFSDK